MKVLSDRYRRVCTYKGYDICTLKVAVPAEGDDLGYVIDDEAFKGHSFLHPEDAIEAIDVLIKTTF